MNSKKIREFGGHFNMLGIAILVMLFSSIHSQAATLKAWGYNTYGQLGLGNNNQQLVPAWINTLSEAKKIAAGSAHTVALMNDGTVKVWGRNTYGQLGLGNNTDTNVPTVVPGLSGVKDIDVGAEHVVALMNDGTIKTWGANHYGQLGFPNAQPNFPYIKVPTTVPGLSNVMQIAVGYYHTLVLMNNGTVKAWGNASAGQLGYGGDSGFGFPTSFSSPNNVPNLSGVKQIVAGGYYTFFLMNDGNVKGCGINNSGELGTGDNSAWVLTPTLVPGLAGAVQIAAGNSHTLAVMNDGTVKACGYNHDGQLGVGDNINKYVPTVVPGLSGASITQIAAGFNHTMALMTDGTVKIWGKNNYGQLGMGDNVNKNVPTEVPGLSGVTQIEAGHYHSLSVGLPMFFIKLKITGL